MSFRDRYQRGVQKHTGHYAAWLPSQSLSLGMVGIFQDGEFIEQTSLGALKIPFQTQPGKSGFSWEHQEHAEILANFDSHERANIRALSARQRHQTKIDFKKKGGFVFQLQKGREESLIHQHALGLALKEAVSLGEWQREWYVVRSIIRAERLVALVSEEESASLTYASARAVGRNKAPLADGGLDLEVTAETGSITKIVATHELTPLFKVLRVKRSFWTGKDSIVYKSNGAPLESEFLEEPFVEELFPPLPDKD
jgi:hypothetical protein